MGTRQYGDGASVGKKQSKNAKVAGTTSGSLGLRLGGMQVYQVRTSQPVLWIRNDLFRIQPQIFIVPGPDPNLTLVN